MAVYPQLSAGAHPLRQKLSAAFTAGRSVFRRIARLLGAASAQRNRGKAVPLSVFFEHRRILGTDGGDSKPASGEKATADPQFFGISGRIRRDQPPAFQNGSTGPANNYVNQKKGR